VSGHSNLTNRHVLQQHVGQILDEDLGMHGEAAWVAVSGRKVTLCDLSLVAVLQRHGRCCM
jgi:hypothetical protein